MSSVAQVFIRLIDELESAHVDYMVMGGWAVQVWGRPRPTYDVDFTLALDDDRLAAFLRALHDKGFLVEDAFLKGFRDRLSGFIKVQVALFQETDPIRVDLFLVASAYQREAFARRVPVAMLGRQVWVMSAEDLILHKLIANRAKDLAAIEEIVNVQRDMLDWKYLRDWAARLSLSSALERFSKK